MKHFLIIGGGLAGSFTAYFLLKQNCKVTLVDSGVNHSSRVAAGQINPMVFRRMTKSWRVDELLPFARTTYAEIAQITEQKIVVETPIRRMFSHDQEKEAWLQKQEDPEFAKYLEKITESDMTFSEAKNICGSGRVKESFYVQADALLSSLQTIISTHENGNWIEEKIDFNTVDANERTWKGTVFDGIIFCTGYENCDNPFFDFLRVDQTKGEVLTITGDIYSEEALNRKCFVLPQPDNTFRIGSTYVWDTPNVIPTEAARTVIVNNFHSLIDAEIQVVDHVAGIRPTTKDRRPVIGEHPEIKGFYVFNGLGAKGYMTAPLLSFEFVEFLLQGKPVHEEVDLRRYD